MWPEAEPEWWGVGRAKPERKAVADLEGPSVQAGDWAFIQEEGKGPLHKVCWGTSRSSPWRLSEADPLPSAPVCSQTSVRWRLPPSFPGFSANLLCLEVS